MNKPLINKPVINKQVLLTALFAICGSAALALPAFAQTAQNNPPTQQTTANTATAKPSNRDQQHPVPAPGSRNCIRDTGSHIPPPKGQCLPLAGNSYSQQDIQRTGQTNVGQALQMLDPRVTVHGH